MHLQCSCSSAGMLGACGLCHTVTNSGEASLHLWTRVQSPYLFNPNHLPCASPAYVIMCLVCFWDRTHLFLFLCLISVFGHSHKQLAWGSGCPGVALFNRQGDGNHQLSPAIELSCSFIYGVLAVLALNMLHSHQHTLEKS